MTSQVCRDLDRVKSRGHVLALPLVIPLPSLDVLFGTDSRSVVDDVGLRGAAVPAAGGHLVALEALPASQASHQTRHARAAGVTVSALSHHVTS